MKKLFCGIVYGICATCNAYADLIPGDVQDAVSMGVGSYCYSDDTTLMIAKVDCITYDGSALFEYSWSDGAWEECSRTFEGVGLCYLGEYEGAHYFCYDGGTQLCPEAGCTEGYTSWTTYSSSAHTVTRKYQTLTESDYFICTGTQTTQYACDSGYYLSGGSTTMSSTNLTCSRCPTAGSTSYGSSSSGNRSNATACYMKKGDTFADSIGSGTFSGTCYYTN